MSRKNKVKNKAKRPNFKKPNYRKMGFKKCVVCGSYVSDENMICRCKDCDNKLKNTAGNREIPEIKFYY